LSFPLNDSDHAVACVVVLEFPSLKLIHSSYKWVTLTLPYIPGYLAFREVEPLVELLKDLKATQPDIYPQVILVDGMNISGEDRPIVTLSLISCFLSHMPLCAHTRS
jgi:endonuclease V